jgi:hypothetical protein
MSLAIDLKLSNLSVIIIMKNMLMEMVKLTSRKTTAKQIAELNVHQKSLYNVYTVIP